MYARIVRFTDVEPERVEAVVQRVQENDGPPEGVTSTGMKLFHDPAQRTAVFLGLFASMEDMKSSEEVLEAMDPSDTPGTRASVDRAEVKFEADA